MNLNPMGGFDSHKVVHSAGSSAREMQAGHRRAIAQIRMETGVADVGFVTRVLGRLRPSGTQLTGSFCQLSDGGTGRIALQRVNGGWVEVCVPA